MRPARIPLVVLALLAVTAIGVPTALSRSDHGQQRSDVVGTGGADILVGTAGNDVLRGWRGDDTLSGLDGDDAIYGGRGADTIAGGPGADSVWCGPGIDQVSADEGDRVASDCEVVNGAETGAVEPPPSGSSESRSVVLVDQQWRCSGPVDLDLVKVTMHAGSDAVSIARGCSGRIGRVEVDTWTADGIKVQNASPVAQDLVIGGGYVECHAISPDSHQDGVQAMGGSRLTMRNLVIDCLGNSNFYVNRAGGGASTPTDVVCDGCVFGPRSASTLYIGSSLRSGARNSVVCEGRYFDIRIEGATGPVTTGTVIVPRSDARCA